jgi:hypothetical protein
MITIPATLPLEVALVLLVTGLYGFWIWSRLRVGRYDALFCSVGIIFMQLISSFRAQDTWAALAATGYHIALVCAVYSISRGMQKDTQVKVNVRVK